jgi:anthranilate phosphoribosyltransferase
MPSYKVMGVPTLGMIDIEVKTLHELGFRRAFVMHGLDEKSGQGMDEVSTLGPTHVAELKEDGTIENYTITPEEFGIERPPFEDIASTRNVDNDALVLLRVLAGKDTGPCCDIVCLNAAPLLYVMGKARDLQEGIQMAREALGDGRVLEKLRNWVTWQNHRPEEGLPTLESMIERM